MNVYANVFIAILLVIEISMINITILKKKDNVSQFFALFELNLYSKNDGVILP